MFEYRLEHLPVNELATGGVMAVTLVQFLNDMGKDGWELTHIVATSFGIFKREKR